MLREKHELNVEDVAAMTGFSRSTLSNIEKGGETNSSHLIEIAKAIGVSPAVLFQFPIDTKPRFPLPRKRKDQKKLTARLRHLTSQTLFKQAKTVAEIQLFLLEKRSLKVSAKQLSVVLLRLAEEGKLKILKKGRKNLYKSV